MNNVIKLSDARNAQMKPAEVLTVLRDQRGQVAGLCGAGSLAAEDRAALAHDLLTLAFWMLSAEDQGDRAAFMILATQESCVRANVSRAILGPEDAASEWIARRLDQAVRSMEGMRA